MRKGVLQQQGPPELLYHEPVNLFVAEFIGSPAMNLFQARFDGENVFLGEQSVPLPARVFAERPGLVSYRGREIAVGVRPEHLIDARTADPTLPRLRGEVRYTEALPPERLVYATVQAQPVVTEDLLEIARDVDAAAVERLEESAEDHFVLACSRFDIGSSEPPRGSYEFAIDAGRMHFFELDTGSAIR
jgi:multiple sugar transport system ATP-binding protein